jgi:hypothetical protein
MKRSNAATEAHERRISNGVKINVYSMKMTFEDSVATNPELRSFLQYCYLNRNDQFVTRVNAGMRGTGPQSDLQILERIIRTVPLRRQSERFIPMVRLINHHEVKYAKRIIESYRPSVQLFKFRCPRHESLLNAIRNLNYRIVETINFEDFLEIDVEVTPPSTPP